MVKNIKKNFNKREYIFIGLLVVLFGISFIYISFFRVNMTGKTILEYYTNESSCAVAGYTWETLTEENCTIVTTCVNDTIEQCECLEYEIINETTNETGECINWNSCINESCSEDQNCDNVTIGGQCIGDVCDSEHLDLCFEEEDCVSAEGYWYYNSCHKDKETVDEVLSNETKEHIDEIVNETEKIENVTDIEEIKELKVMPMLTNDEREILVNKFGNESVKIIKAEQVEKGIEITFELKDYFMTRFYDEEFSKEELNFQMEKDRINWLKDIANTLLQNTNSPENIDDFVGEYPI